MTKFLLLLDGRALPTKTKVESGISQSRSGTFLTLVTVDSWLGGTACPFVKPRFTPGGSWTGPFRRERAPRVRISWTVFGVKALAPQSEGARVGWQAVGSIFRKSTCLTSVWQAFGTIFQRSPLAVGALPGHTKALMLQVRCICVATFVAGK